MLRRNLTLFNVRGGDHSGYQCAQTVRPMPGDEAEDECEPVNANDNHSPSWAAIGLVADVIGDRIKGVSRVNEIF